MAHGFVAGDAVSVAVVESISRMIGVAGGGTLIKLRGYFFLGATGVTFAGNAATSVTVVSDNVITCLTPAGTASETRVDVIVINGSGSSAALAAAFEYAPAATTTYVSETFAGSSFGGFSTTGSPTIVAIPSPLGTAATAVLCTGPSGVGEQSININIANNPALNQPNGWWWACPYLIPSATMAIVEANGQIKTFIGRVFNSDPATMIDAVGAEETGAGAQMKAVIDINSVGVLGSVPGFPMGDALWAQEMQQITRNGTTHTGRCRRWMNGQLIMNTTSADIGDDTGTDVVSPRWGLVFTQNTAAGTLRTYVGPTWSANGYIEPLY